jgi:hypothetical protein
MVSESARTEKITNFFSKIAVGILIGFLIAGILLAVSSPGWIPLMADFLPKYFPQYQNIWWIVTGVLTGVGVFFALFVRWLAKGVEENRYDREVNPIIEVVNGKSHTDEEKKAIETILKVLNNKIISEPISSVLFDLRQDHKNHYELASPYIQEYIKNYIAKYF